MEARKITFQEAWNSTSIFFVDETLEAEIDHEVDNLLIHPLGMPGVLRPISASLFGKI